MKYCLMKAFLVMIAALFLMSGDAFSVRDESLRTGDKIETSGPNPDHVNAINTIANYLDKMGRKDVGAKLRDDFKSGKVYIGKLESGANAEVNPGALGAGRTMAINETIINQMGSGRVKASGANVANWSLTVFHEYVHMGQWLPMEDSSHETPAWAATLRENGQWIRKTLNNVDQAGQDNSLTPQERVERLNELRQTLADLQGSFNVTLNELRGKLATGDLDRDYKWQGVPPAGGLEATGTRHIDALEKYANVQVQAGVQEANRLIEKAKKEIADITAKTGPPATSPAPVSANTGISEIVGVWTGKFGNEEAQFDLTLTFGADGTMKVSGPLERLQFQDGISDSDNSFSHSYETKKTVPYSYSSKTVSVEKTLLSTGTHTRRSVKKGTSTTWENTIYFSLTGSITGRVASGKCTLSVPRPGNKYGDYVLVFPWQATKR